MSAAKRRKICTENQTTSEISKTEFYALNDDCILQILDWLSIAELAATKMTCKRLYLLANEHFRKTYKNKYEQLSKFRGKLKIRIKDKYFQSFQCHNPRIHCSYAGIETFKHIGDKMSQNVKHISFWEYPKTIRMRPVHCEYAKDVLQNVEIVELVSCSSINNLLKHCTKLEYLSFWVTKSEELSHTYPKLKQLGWQSSMDFPPELKAFFTRNPTIKTFSAQYQNSITTTNWLLQNRIIIDDLVLTIRKESDNSVMQIIENVHALHRNHQIKRLHVKIEDMDFLLYPKMPEFIESLHFNMYDGRRQSIYHVISNMPNLKFLYYFEPNNTCQYTVLAKRLKKLEEFHTDYIKSMNELIPFVRHSPKLQIIYAMYFVSCYFPEDFTTNLQMLDKERRKLKDACKLTIYVEEELYLRVKFNSSTNRCGLVEIKRVDSYPLSKHPMRPNALSVLEARR